MRGSNPTDSQRNVDGLSRLEEFGFEGIGVTTLCSQLWCEMQTELTLRYGKKRTPVMISGGERHRELHEETAELIPVKTRTKADNTALLFQNMISCTRQLQHRGLTREFPVIGEIPPLKIRGQIDELVLRDDAVYIRDYKTRRSPTLPSYWQQRCTETQLMFYHKLLSDIVIGEFTIHNALNMLDLDRDDSVSDEFHSAMNENGLELHSPNVSEIGEHAFNLLRALPSISDRFTVTYEHQETKKKIGVHEFALNKKGFSRDLEFILGYWTGERDAIPVGEKNRWKCRFCEHASRCPVWTLTDEKDEYPTERQIGQ